VSPALKYENWVLSEIVTLLVPMAVTLPYLLMVPLIDETCAESLHSNAASINRLSPKYLILHDNFTVIKSLLRTANITKLLNNSMVKWSCRIALAGFLDSVL
jgi:hypothetical protein